MQNKLRHSRDPKKAWTRPIAIALLATAPLLSACGGQPELAVPGPHSHGTVDQPLVDLTTCGPTNLALNTSGAGFPSPLESDPSETGSAWDLVDGETEYGSVDRGLLFEAGGTHQVTVDFGRAVTFDEVVVWHSPDNGVPGHNIPSDVSLEVFDGAAWLPVADAERSYQLPICSMGELRCEGQELQVCNAEGTGFVLQELCDPFECVNEACAVCMSGDRRCVGDDLQTCVDGMWSSNVLCAPFGCVPDNPSYCGECFPGETRCLDTDSYATCGAAGVWISAPTNCGEPTSACIGGACVQPTCSDGFQDGDETDDDCGGSCPPCIPGQGCGVNADCTSLNCQGNECQEPLCTDVIQNGDETAVDCGGSCPGCLEGQACSTGSDCASLVCSGGACQAPFCGDGIVSPGEECDDGNDIDNDTCSNSCLAQAQEFRIEPVGEEPAAALVIGEPPYVSYPDTYAFSPVMGTKVRWSYDGDGLNVLGDPGGPGPEFLLDARSVAANYLHSCAARATGEVVCWGQGNVGQLGNGSTEDSSVPVPVANLTDAPEVAAGAFFSCARRTTGAVACWGENTLGQLGNGNNVNSSEPVAVSGLADAVQITAHGNHACALRAGGEVVCWGYGNAGRLGNGSQADSNIPVPVVGLSDAVAVAAGGYHTCAVRSSGAVVCWGNGLGGQLGNGNLDVSLTPVTVVGLDDATSLAAGEAHTCAVRATGEVACWGRGAEGQIGDGNFYTQYPYDVPTPASVLNVDDAVLVGVGSFHSCAVRTTGELVCWGAGTSGQLGTGAWDSSSSPVAVVDLADVSRVAGGYVHTCAATTLGEALCWGANGSGQLGNGGTETSEDPAYFGFSSEPVSVWVGPAAESWQAWIHEITVSGCPEPPPTEAVSDTVLAGESVGTDSESDGATPADPVETLVTTPTGGFVSIEEGPITQPPPDGFNFFGMQVNITAPPAPVTNPLVFEFVIDISLLPPGADENDVEIFKNSALVAACLAAPNAIPDPCVASRAVSGDDVVITVLTTTASAWTFGVALPSDRDGDGTLDGYDDCADDPDKVEPGICGCQVSDDDSDGDGTPDCNDPCPTDADDACLEAGDSDGDGVDDADDDCAETPAGQIVNAEGCTTDQRCPCAGPAGSGEPWRNHGQYVSCVSQVATAFRQAGLISNSDSAAIVSDASRSECGHKQ